MKKNYQNLSIDQLDRSIVFEKWIQGVFRKTLLFLAFYLCANTSISAQCNTDVPLPFINSTYGNLNASGSITGGLCLLCSASDESRLIDNDLNNFARATITLGAAVSANYRVTDTDTEYAAGTYVGYRIDTGGLLDVDVLGSITISTYLNGNLRETVSGSSLLGVGLLNGSGNNYVVGFNTTQSFDAIEIAKASLVGVASSIDVYYPVIRNYCVGSALSCNSATTMNLPSYPVSLEPSHTGVSGIALGTIYDANNVISTNANDYATITLTAGVAASGSIAVKDQLTDYPSGTYAGFEIENSSLLNVSALGNVSITTYLNGVQQEQFSGSNLIVNGSLLNNSGFYKVGFVTTTSFDETQIFINQTVALNLGSTRVYSAVFENFCAGPDLACNTQTAMLTPTYPVYINGINTGIDGLVCALCSINDADNLIDQNESNFAQINLTVSVGNSGSISVKNQITDYPIGTFAGFTIENPSLLNVNALDAVMIRTYLNGALQETKFGNAALAAVGTDLLVGSSPQTIGFISTKAFDEARITITNTATVSLGVVKVYHAVFQKLCPVTLECNKTYAVTNPTFPVIIDSGKTGVDGVACVACAVNNANNVLTASTTDFASILVTAGVLAPASIAVLDQLSTYPVGTFAGFTIKDLNSLVQLDLFSSLTISTYLDGVMRESKSASNLLGLSLLTPYGSGSGIYNVGFQASQTFDEIRISVGSLASVINDINVYGAFINTASSSGGTLFCAVIDAVDDALPSVVGATGSLNAGNVLINDTINGNAVAISDIDLTVITPALPMTVGAAVPFIDPVTGIVSIPSGTPASNYIITYQICYKLNSLSCDSATVMVTVTAPVILANDDTTSINGYTGGTTSINVLTNDSLNGTPVNPSEVTLTSTPNGPLTVNTDGSITVVANTPAGSYTVAYQICERLNPLNCDTATVMVTVTAPVILANDDITSINGYTGGTTPINVLTNDSLNGTPVNPLEVTLTSTPNGPLTVNTDGSITVAPNTPAGNYTVTYQICEKLNPSNCDTATVTVIVMPPVILANDDTGETVGTVAGGTAFANVLGNDTLNGSVVTSSQVNTTFVSSTNPGITLSGTDVIVAAGTPVGNYTLTYQICEILNSTNCDSAVVNVIVAATGSTILANNDIGTAVNGYLGGTAFTNVLGNDILNAAPATIFNVNVSFVSSTDSRITLSGTDVIVAAGTPAGTYSLDYQICAISDPTNCDVARVTITVVPAAIVATDDAGTTINGYSGGTAFTNVLVNDTLNNTAVTSSQVNTTFVSSTDSGITLLGTDVIVLAGTPAGSYSLTYQICEKLNPSNCDTATVTVTVTAPVILANDDTTSINGYTGGTASVNVLTNDTLNGTPVNPSEVTLTSTPNGPLTVNTDGSITVAANTPAGTYTVTYQICEKLNPSNCDTATVTVTVMAPVILANDDTTSINGYIGGTTPINVLTNDSLNGNAVNPSEITLSSTPNGPLTVNTDGSITVAPNTPAGTYTVTYQICEKLNPSNCDTATVTVTVTAPVILANDDTTSINGYTGGTPPLNVLANDSLNGIPVNPSEVTLTSTPNGLLTVNTDGSITVTPNTAGGTYTVNYTICEVLNPTNCDTATVTVFVSSPSIALVKTSVIGGTGAVGNVITYTFTVTNTGNTTLSNIVVNDALTASVNLAVIPNTLAPNTTGTATAIYVIKQSDMDAGKVTNSATVTGTTPTSGTVTDTSGTMITNDTPTETTLNPSSSIAMVKTSAIGGTGAVGNVISYTFTVTNTGNTTLSNIVVNDALTASVNLAVNPSALAPNATGIATAIYTIKQSDIDAGKVTNSATITGSTPSGGTVTDTSGTTIANDTPTVTTLSQNPSIALIKIAVFNDNNGDGYAQMGETINYAFTVMNTGNLALTNVVLTDTLPGIIITGGSINLAVGETNTTSFSGVYTLTQQDIINGSVHNQAMVTATNAAGIEVVDMSDDDSPTQDDSTVLSVNGCAIEIFNAVSADGDGLNDFFRIRGIECYPKNTVEIYNRWGIKVYNAEGYNNNSVAFRGISEGRDTLSQSEGLPSGTYFYIVKYEDSSKNGIAKSGYLDLKRE